MASEARKRAKGAGNKSTAAPAKQSTASRRNGAPSDDGPQPRKSSARLYFSLLLFGIAFLAIFQNKILPAHLAEFLGLAPPPYEEIIKDGTGAGGAIGRKSGPTAVPPAGAHGQGGASDGGAEDGVPTAETKFWGNLQFPPPLVPLLPPAPVRKADKARQAAVVEAFKHSWSAYERDAWGSDEYHPHSKHGSNLSHVNVEQGGGGMGYTILDSLDSLLLMGLHEEYARARDWVKNDLTFEREGKFNLFETTIRNLGGLLSAHALCSSEDARHSQHCGDRDADLYLKRADELADKLRPAFKTPTGIPLRDVNLMTGEAWPDMDNWNTSSLAEATTVQLEFKYLAHLTEDRSYWEIAERPMSAVFEAMRHSGMEGLGPIFIDPERGQFVASEVRLGSRADSFYEYLLKQWLQTGRQETVYREQYDRSMTSIKQFLLRNSTFSDPPLIFTVELRPTVHRGENSVQMIPKQDHLVCFIGGSFMLGATNGAPLPITDLNDVTTQYMWALEDWTIGHELIRTCMNTYTETTTGLGAEIVMFNVPGYAPEPFERDWYIKQAPKGQGPLLDARNILRPETVESLFIAFQLTGDVKYREWGWQMFQAFEKHCKVPSGGYASIDDVDAKDGKPKQINKMETFWLSETLKYMYLLFSDQDVLPLTDWVFNTEAHPLPVFTPSFPTGVV